MEPPPNYQIAIIGPVPRDHIITHENEVIRKYGCVTHTAIGLAKLTSGMATVYPVSHVRKKDHQEIQQLLEKYSNIDLKGALAPGRIEGM